MGALPDTAATNASAISCADWNRPAGSRVNARTKNASTDADNSGTTKDGGGHESVHTRTMTSPVFVPGKGALPVSILYKMTAMDHKSLR